MERTQTNMKRLVTVFFAMALAMAMSPLYAFAAANPVAADSTGDITVSSGLEAGDTVSAYKIISATYNASTNSVTYAWNGIDPGMTVEQFSALTGDALKAAVEKIATLVGQADGSATVAEGKTGATVEGLSMGQYLLLVTPGAASTTKTVYQVTTVNLVPEAIDGNKYKLEDATVASIKNQPLDIPKTITAPDNSQVTTTDGYQNGDVITFTLKPTVPSYPKNEVVDNGDGTQTITTVGNKIFNIGDTMDSGLEFSDAQFAAISVKDAAGNAVPTDAYTITKDGNGFKIVFDCDKIENLYGTQLTITYQATLNAQALDGIEKNTATLEYNRNPFDNSDSSKKTITTEVEDHSFGFYLLKKGDDGKALKGATFEVKDASGKLMGTITTDDNGYAGLNGLKEAGVYTLHESVVPAGYVAVADFNVTIDKTQATNDNPATVAVESNFQNAGEITDATQPDLPVTGGMGTMAITAIGILLAAACVFMAMRYRRSRQS